MMRDVDRDILRLAIPSVVTNITVPLLGLVDTAITGHMGRPQYIGAIAIGTTIFNISYWIFAFLRMGTTGLVAQAYGRGDIAQVKSLMSRSLLLSLMFSALLLVAQRFILSLSLWLMPAEAEVHTFVTTYFNICIFGAPAMLALFALNGWFIGCQDTRSPMVVALLQNVLNIVLSLYLVCGCGWKIEGVATGTLVAQWAAVLMALMLARRRMCRVSRLASMQARTSSTRTAPLPLTEFFRVNRDIFLRTLCLVAVTLFFTSTGSRQGNEILAANALLMQFFIFYSYFTDGLANAGEALSGRHAGAGNISKLMETIRALFVHGGFVAAAFSLLYLTAGHAILRLLTDQPEVAATAAEFLPWVVAIPIVALLAMVWDGVFTGLTWTRQMLLSMSAAAALFFGIFLLGRAHMGNHALWMAFVCYLFTRGAVQTLFVISKTKHNEL